MCPIGGHLETNNEPAEQEREHPDGEGVAASARFKDLLGSKRRFIVPAFLFFFVYYFWPPVADCVRTETDCHAGSRNRPIFPRWCFAIFWRRFNTAGAVAGLAVGLLGSVGLILAGPKFMGIDPPDAARMARHLLQAKPWFPLENPGLLSVPLGFLAAIAGTLLTAEPAAEAKFNEFTVRVHTGLGAEPAEAP